MVGVGGGHAAWRTLSWRLTEYIGVLHKIASVRRACGGRSATAALTVVPASTITSPKCVQNKSEMPQRVSPAKPCDEGTGAKPESLGRRMSALPHVGARPSPGRGLGPLARSCAPTCRARARPVVAGAHAGAGPALAPTSQPPTDNTEETRASSGRKASQLKCTKLVSAPPGPMVKSQLKSQLVQSSPMVTVERPGGTLSTPSRDRDRGPPPGHPPTPPAPTPPTPPATRHSSSAPTTLLKERGRAAAAHARRVGAAGGAHRRDSPHKRRAPNQTSPPWASPVQDTPPSPGGHACRPRAIGVHCGLRHQDEKTHAHATHAAHAPCNCFHCPLGGPPLPPGAGMPVAEGAGPPARECGGTRDGAVHTNTRTRH